MDCYTLCECVCVRAFVYKCVYVCVGFDYDRVYWVSLCGGWAPSLPFGIKIYARWINK